MSTTNLSTVASDLIGSYGNTAKNVIDAYRAGGEHVVTVLEQRWNRALKESRPQLTSEVAKNATAAQLVFSALYCKGLMQSTNVAQQLVTQVVKLAETCVERVASNASKFEEKTGVKAFNTMARASVPGVQVLSKLANQIEGKTAELAGKIAGNDVVTASVKRATAFTQKKRTVKAF